MQTLFVSLLGDRYGWVPPPERMPRTLEKPLYRLRHDREISSDLAGQLSRFWEAMGCEEAGQSITEGEIVYRRPQSA